METIVVIIVEGGVVQEVYAPASVDVLLLDRDDQMEVAQQIPTIDPLHLDSSVLPRE